MNVKARLIWDEKSIELTAHETKNKSVYEVAIMAQADATLLCPVNDGRLRASIAIQTKETFTPGPGQAPNSEDIIEKPTEEGTAYVGTATPYAKYVEYGTGAHKTADGAEKFAELLDAWLNKKGIMDKAARFLIKRHIRRHGTKPQPFMRPALDLISGKNVTVIMQTAWDEAAKKYLKKYRASGYDK